MPDEDDLIRIDNGWGVKCAWCGERHGIDRVATCRSLAHKMGHTEPKMSAVRRSLLTMRERMSNTIPAMDSPFVNLPPFTPEETQYLLSLVEAERDGKEPGMYSPLNWSMDTALREALTNHKGEERCMDCGAAYEAKTTLGDGTVMIPSCTCGEDRTDAMLDDRFARRSQTG